MVMAGVRRMGRLSLAQGGARLLQVGAMEINRQRSSRLHAAPTSQVNEHFRIPRKYAVVKKRMKPGTGSVYV
jgi:hypothetical protein